MADPDFFLLNENYLSGAYGKNSMVKAVIMEKTIENN